MPPSTTASLNNGVRSGKTAARTGIPARAAALFGAGSRSGVRRPVVRTALHPSVPWARQVRRFPWGQWDRCFQLARLVRWGLCFRRGRQGRWAPCFQPARWDRSCRGRPWGPETLWDPWGPWARSVRVGRGWDGAEGRAAADRAAGSSTPRSACGSTPNPWDDNDSLSCSFVRLG